MSSLNICFLDRCRRGWKREGRCCIYVGAQYLQNILFFAAFQKTELKKDAQESSHCFVLCTQFICVLNLFYFSIWVNTNFLIKRRPSVSSSTLTCLCINPGCYSFNGYKDIYMLILILTLAQSRASVGLNFFKQFGLVLQPLSNDKQNQG